MECVREREKENRGQEREQRARESKRERESESMRKPTLIYFLLPWASVDSVQERGSPKSQPTTNYFDSE